MKLKTLHKIFGNTTSGETQGIVVRHKSGVRFFTGKESDADPACTENYPLFYLEPVACEMEVNDSQWINEWALTMVIVDILPQDRDTERINETLDKVLRILQDIIMEFLTNYFDGREITFDNTTETIDLSILGKVRVTPLIDSKESNLTGYSATMIIREQIHQRDVVCCLDEKFN